MKRSSIKEILDKFKWHPELDFSIVRIRYIDRPKGYSEISGDEIEEVGHMFLYLTSGAAIPHHRVVEIRYKDEVVWRKQ